MPRMPVSATMVERRAEAQPMASTTRRKSKLEHVEFIFRIGRPALDYGFRLQREEFDPDPYDESLHLTFGLWCLYPDRLKGREGEARFIGDLRKVAGSAHRTKPAESPKAVGSVVIRKLRLEMSAFLPPDAVWGLSGAISAGTISSVLAGGRWIKRSHAHLNSISFQGPDFDPIEYIG